MITAMGDNYFLDKDRFTFQIGDSPIQQEIKFLETNMASCCGVKKYAFSSDNSISFNVSGRYEEFVENIRKNIDKMVVKSADVMFYPLKPNTKLPRKLKKAYKNRKKWALIKVNSKWPIFSLKDCTISLDVADGKDYSSEVIYDLKSNRVISIKRVDSNG